MSKKIGKLKKIIPTILIGISLPVFIFAIPEGPAIYHGDIKVNNKEIKTGTLECYNGNDLITSINIENSQFGKSYEKLIINTNSNSMENVEEITCKLVSCNCASSSKTKTVEIKKDKITKLNLNFEGTNSCDKDNNNGNGGNSGGGGSGGGSSGSGGSGSSPNNNNTQEEKLENSTQNTPLDSKENRKQILNIQNSKSESKDVDLGKLPETKTTSISEQNQQTNDKLNTKKNVDTNKETSTIKNLLSGNITKTTKNSIIGIGASVIFLCGFFIWRENKKRKIRKEKLEQIQDTNETSIETKIETETKNSEQGENEKKEE